MTIKSLAEYQVDHGQLFEVETAFNAGVKEASDHFELEKIKIHEYYAVKIRDLMGGEEKLAYIKKKLNIQNGKSPDGKFSLEEAECLCASEMAPRMQVNDAYHGPLTEEADIDKLLDQLK